MQFSASKCCVLKISQKHKSTDPQVRMGPIILHPVKTASYLGVKFDSSLSFKAHIQHLVETKGRLFNLFQQLTHCRSVVHEHILLRLNKACLRPKIEFASAVWCDASQTQLKQIESLHHRGICQSLGANRLSHKADVCVEAGVPPVHVRHKVEVLRLWAQLARHRGPAAEWLESFPKADLYLSPRRSSFLVRLSNILRECNLSIAEAKSLKKPHIRAIEEQLWRKSWKSVHQPSVNNLLDADGRQARYNDYARLHQDIFWYRPKAYSSTSRPVVALWHMLRLGTAPLHDFLTKVGCHDNRYCDCGIAPETTHHFLLQCQRFGALRANMLAEIRRVAPSILVNLEVAGLLGNPGKLPESAIDAIFVAVTDFIRLSNRFHILINPPEVAPD